jgi:hypothetical protein
MVNKKNLEATLLEVANSDASNYTTIARKHNIYSIILNYYIYSVTISRYITTKISKRLLTNT